MTLTKNPKYFGPLLTLLFVAICLLAIFAVQEERQPKTGVTAYLEDCAGEDSPADSCGSVAAIKTAFGFDLLAEVNDSHSRMKETAKKIADGQLTEEAYQECLKKKECAAVPMLGEGVDPHSKEAALISRLFWQLVERDRMNEDVCGLIPACVMALDKKIIVLKNGRVAEASP
ncbi:MAG: hypothetical protein ACXW30_04785 [Micavibrio sp.]